MKQFFQIVKCIEFGQNVPGVLLILHHEGVLAFAPTVFFVFEYVELQFQRLFSPTEPDLFHASDGGFQFITKISKGTNRCLAKHLKDDFGLGWLVIHTNQNESVALKFFINHHVLESLRFLTWCDTDPLGMSALIDSCKHTAINHSAKRVIKKCSFHKFTFLPF